MTSFNHYALGRGRRLDAPDGRRTGPGRTRLPHGRGGAASRAAASPRRAPRTKPPTAGRSRAGNGTAIGWHVVGTRAARRPPPWSRLPEPAGASGSVGPGRHTSSPAGSARSQDDPPIPGVQSVRGDGSMAEHSDPPAGLAADRDRARPATADHADPYTDVDVWARLRGRDRRAVCAAPRSGTAAATWRIRFAARHSRAGGPGRTSASVADPGLAGRTGELHGRRRRSEDAEMRSTGTASGGCRPAGAAWCTPTAPRRC